MSTMFLGRCFRCGSNKMTYDEVESLTEDIITMIVTCDECGCEHELASNVEWEVMNKIFDSDDDYPVTEGDRVYFKTKPFTRGIIKSIDRRTKEISKCSVEIDDECRNEGDPKLWTVFTNQIAKVYTTDLKIGDRVRSVKNQKAFGTITQINPNVEHPNYCKVDWNNDEWNKHRKNVLSCYLEKVE